MYMILKQRPLITPRIFQQMWFAEFDPDLQTVFIFQKSTLVK